MKNTPGPWHAMERITPSLTDPGFRLVASVDRGTPRHGVYAESARMLQEGKGFVWGDPIEDVVLLAAAPELLHMLAEATGMLSACMEILSGRMRASNNAAKEIREQHARCLALLKKVAPREPPKVPREPSSSESASVISRQIKGIK